MKLDCRLSLLGLGLWYLIALALATSATTESIMSTSEAITEDLIEETTADDYQPKIEVVEQYEYPTVCYVEKSKVSELLIAMNKTVVHLNSADKFLQCHEKWEVIQMDPETKMEVCSEARIAQIQGELDEVAGRLIQLAFRLEEPSTEEVGSLDLRKFRLIDSLNALRVYYGPSPCDGSIVVCPSRPLTEYVEHSMNQVLALFQTPRSTRPPQPATTVTPATTTKPSIDDMLDPEKTLTELTELGRLNPAAMPKALPRIVSQRYNGRSTTFNNLLEFIVNLDTTENKIIGVSALYNEMHRYNQIPIAKKLKEVASVVQHLDESAARNLLDAASSAKLTDLVNDPDLEQFFFRIDSRMSFAELTDLARMNPTAMSTALPLIVSQRYNASVSPFDSLVQFIADLPTPEIKLIGFAAVHQELSRSNRSVDLRHLLKLSEYFEGLKVAPAGREFFETPHLSELTALTVIGEKADCEISNVAYPSFKLIAKDWDSPYSGYLCEYCIVYQIRVFPKIKNQKLVFRILISLSYGPGFFPFQAYNTNPNTNSNTSRYTAKSSERYLLWDFDPQSKRTTNEEIDWKLIPAPGKDNQFRILSAKFDDFMFAHKSATGFRGWRRVLLGRKGFPEYDHIANADLWHFDCTPGTYAIPSD